MAEACSEQAIKLVRMVMKLPKFF